MSAVDRKHWSGIHVAVRPAYPSDGEALARLAGQLGYDLDASEAARRLQALPATDCAFVATTASGVIGLLHLSVVRGLFEPPFVEVAVLILGQGWQGLGIGRRLMTHAETWAREQRLSRVDVRPDYVDENVRSFFSHLGYGDAESPYVLSKALA